MKDQIIARYKSTRAFPSYGKGRPLIHVDAKAYTLGGNQHPYFSITATVDDQWTRRNNDCRSCDCLHDEILRLWPVLAPIVALHLSDANTGEPMHAEANGWYWLCGASDPTMHEPGKQPARYDKRSDECLALLASHLRVSPDVATTIRDAVRHALENPATHGEPRARFAEFVNAQRERWQAEAQAGIALLNELSERQTFKREQAKAKLAMAGN